MSIIRSRFESPDLKMGIILAVLKHSVRIYSDKLSKSVETVWETREAKIV